VLLIFLLSISASGCAVIVLLMVGPFPSVSRSLYILLQLGSSDLSDRRKRSLHSDHQYPDGLE
jgi:hypothetical protein